MNTPTPPEQQAPDFDALRKRRNESVRESIAKIAAEFGCDPEKMTHNHNDNSCYCACASGGPCEHKWDGPAWYSEDGCGMSVTCSRCGGTAMSHSLRVGP